MAYSTQEWQVVKAYYERGLSLAEIIARDDVAIKSRSQICKKAVMDSWDKTGKKKQLIDREVAVRTDLAGIRNEKETFNTVERNIHNDLVDERTRHIQFFNNAAITNVKAAMEDECTGQADYRTRAETILKGKETVIGKIPETAIQVNNNRDVVLNTDWDAIRRKIVGLKKP